MASSKNEESGAQDAAERIKAQALSAAKGLSRLRLSVLLLLLREMSMHMDKRRKDPVDGRKEKKQRGRCI